jgi:hypothetical protein
MDAHSVQVSGALSVSGGITGITITQGPNPTEAYLRGAVTADPHDLQLSQQVLTLNLDGPADTASNVGLQIQEDGAIAGYIRTTEDRGGYAFRAPAALADDPDFTVAIPSSNVVLFNGGQLALSNNRVGVGTAAPSYALDVQGTVQASGWLMAKSDARLQRNLDVLGDALARVKQLTGYTFDMDDVPRSTGLVAQEVALVLPEAVCSGDDGLLSVAYGNMLGLVVEAIKELDAKLDRLAGLGGQ